MEKHMLITISRQFGSGGREVSKILAKKLGVRRYLAMIPYFSNAKDKLDDSGDLVLVKVFEDEDGEEYFEDIPDDDEYETVADLFINRLQDLFEIDEQ